MKNEGMEPSRERFPWIEEVSWPGERTVRLEDGEQDVQWSVSLPKRPTMMPTFNPKINLPTVEIDALHEFYNVTHGVNWLWNITERRDPIGQRWNFSGDPNPCASHWLGIVCHCAGFTCHVQELSLPLTNITGPLSAALGQLTQLVNLELPQNKLTSTIPDVFYNLSALQIFDIHINRVRGTLSEAIAQWENIRIINVTANELAGTLPAGLFNLTQLQVADLGENWFHGTLSDDIAKLTSLQEFTILNNSFVGPLPCKAIGRLPSLSSFIARFNSFSGSLTAELFTSPALVSFDVGTNKVTGSLPAGDKIQSPLDRLHVNTNAMTGYLPQWLYTLPSLKSLFLYQNMFEGSLSANISNLVNLVELSLRYNSLTGTVPSGFLSLDKLNVVGFQYNFFYGSAEPLYRDKPILTALELSGNHFSGVVPVIPRNQSHIFSTYAIQSNLYHGNLSEITVFSNPTMLVATLAGNAFSGPLPMWIANFRILALLDLGDNAFSGTISPHFLANCGNLAELTLSQNYLTGTLPASVGNLYDLTLLDVSENALTGTVPDLLPSLNRLKTLYLSNNLFTGPLTSFERLNDSYNLVNIDLSGNFLQGTLAPTFFLGEALQSVVLSSNCIYGSLPASLCQAKNLVNAVMDGLSTASRCQRPIFPNIPYFTSFSLSKQMVGTVPSCVFSLPKLQSLHLSGNAFSGTLPSSVNISNSLLELTLSNNMLRGTIPREILTRPWTQLDLSFNKLDGTLSDEMPALSVNQSLALQVNRLSGRIPLSLQAAQSIQLLDGNIFSCGIDRVGLPAHDPDVADYSCATDAIVSAVSTWAVLLALSAAALCVLLWRVLYKKARKNDRETVCVEKCESSLSHKSESESETVRDNSLMCESADTTTDTSHTLVSQHSLWITLSVFVHNALSLWHSVHRHLTKPPVATANSLSLVIFTQLLKSIREVFLRLTALLCLVLLPTYCALSHYQSIYTHTYAWQGSAILLSGVASGVALTLLFVLVIALLVHWFTRKIFALALSVRSLTLAERSKERERDRETEREGERDTMQSVRHAVDISHAHDTQHNDVTHKHQIESTRTHSKAALHSVEEDALWLRTLSTASAKSLSTISLLSTSSSSATPASALSWTSFCASLRTNCSLLCSPPVLLAVAIGVLNFAAMMCIDVAYVRVALTQDRSVVLVVQICLSFFKIVWNEAVLFALYPFLKRLLLRRRENTGETKEQIESLFSRREVGFLVFTVILNNIIIPCVSVAIVSSDCYYNAFFAQPPTEETTLETCTLYVTAGRVRKCAEYASSTQSTTFKTPFFYRFQCGAALVQNFAAVHVFTFITAGLLLPIAKLCASFVYAHVFERYRALSLQEREEENESHGTQRKSESERERDRQYRRGVELLYKLLSLYLPASLQDPRALLHKHIATQANGECSTVTYTVDTHSHHFLRKEKLVVRLCAHLSIVLSFGAIFPPIAAIGCAAVFTSTLWEEYCLGYFLSRAFVLCDRQAYELYRTLMNNDCHGIGKLWYGVLWLLTPFASFLFAWILFDTIGDSYGWQYATIPAVGLFAFPFLCLCVVYFLEKMGLLEVEQLVFRRLIAELVTAEEQLGKEQQRQDQRRETELPSISVENPMRSTFLLRRTDLLKSERSFDDHVRDDAL